MSQRKAIWGWFFYDWATQPFHTLLMTFIFGPYFAIVASQYYLGLGQDETLADANAQIVWSNCLAITGLIIGFGGPILGSIADTTGTKRPWIGIFSLVYLVTACALWYTYPDGSNMWLMLTIFGICFAIVPKQLIEKLVFLSFTLIGQLVSEAGSLLGER